MKIVIIKDESQKKINIKIRNYLCLKIQKLEYDLESVNFKVVLSKKIYRLFILNNCKKGKEIDLNSGDIWNSPLNLLTFFDNIDVNKFNGQILLNKILDDFTKSSNNNDNPLNFNINSYMNKQVCNYNPYDFNKFIKINNNLYTYFNIIPFHKNFYPCLFKILSIISHLVLFECTLIMFVAKKEEDDDDEPIPIPALIILCIYLYSFWGLFLYGWVICKLIQCCKDN